MKVEYGASPWRPFDRRPTTDSALHRGRSSDWCGQHADHQIKCVKQINVNVKDSDYVYMLTIRIHNNNRCVKFSTSGSSRVYVKIVRPSSVLWNHVEFSFMCFLMLPCVRCIWNAMENLQIVFIKTSQFKPVLAAINFENSLCLRVLAVTC
jgi:hypothetical protein